MEVVVLQIFGIIERLSHTHNMYKAQIIHKSDVDVTGMFEITYRILFSDIEVYPNITISCKPEKVEEIIKEKMTELKAARDLAETIEVPSEITL